MAVGQLCDIDRHLACRSLMAAYELASTGYQKVSILQGGFNEWKRSGRWATVLEVSCVK